MAAIKTLANVRTLSRLYADQRNDQFIDDDELDVLINLKVRHLFDLLVQARGADYYASEETITLVPGTSRYFTPLSFYQLSAVVIEWPNRDHEVMAPIKSMRERARFTSFQRAWSDTAAKGYMLRGQYIEFLPIPNAAVDVTLQFVPEPGDLGPGNEEFDFINGWEKMVALGVAIELLAIDKRTSATLNGLYQEELDRIDTMKTERDAEATHEVIDVDRINPGSAYGPTFGDPSFDPSFW